MQSSEALMEHQEAFIEYRGALLEYQETSLEYQPAFIEYQETLVQETFVEYQNALLEYHEAIIKYRETLMNCPNRVSPLWFTSAALGPNWSEVVPKRTILTTWAALCRILFLNPGKIFLRPLREPSGKGQTPPRAWRSS